MRTRLFSWFNQLVSLTTLGLSSLVLVFLTWQLTHQRAYMPLTIAEDMNFVNQAPGFLVSVGAFLFGLFVLAPLLRKISDHKLFAVLSLIFLLAGAYLIKHVDPVIRADARHVFDAAKAMNLGDFTFLTQKGAYLYLHPHQLGLVSLDRVYLLFSDSPVLIFWGNLGLVLGTIYCQNLIVRTLFPNGLVSKYQLILAFSFLPQLFFILFAYGSIPGAFLIFLAMSCLLKVQQTNHRIWGIVALVAASLAGIIRNNYQIFLIALVILWLASFAKTGLKRYLVLPFGLLVTFFLFTYSLNAFYSYSSGQPLSEGVPKIAYVTMGLQPDPKGSVGGWWNTYNTRLLKRQQFDQQKAKEQAIADLQIEIEHLTSDLDYAQLFFTQKVLSTWLDPTFQSIWTGPLVERYQKTYGLLPTIYEEGDGYDRLNQYGAVWLWSIYGLSAVWWLMRWRHDKTDFFDLLPFIFFLGGFFFHLVWETKSQYVLIYVFSLIQPAAVVLGTIAEQLWQFLPLHSNRQL